MPVNPGKPSEWLLKNSKGYPDFLFTILTCSMLLLALVTLFWLGFGFLSFKYAATEKAATILSIMDNLKAGLISLVGVIFGLAGSYTVRRFKRDEHHAYMERMHRPDDRYDYHRRRHLPTQMGLNIVTDEEDI